MKTRLVRLIIPLMLVVSSILAPIGTALAAPEWHCGNVKINSISMNNGNNVVSVTLFHSNFDPEKIDFNWGDGSSLFAVHTATSPTNSVYTDTLTHSYTATGTYVLTMRVFDSSTPAHRDCGAILKLGSCFGGATNLAVSQMDAFKVVSATVSYTGTASLLWGDGSAAQSLAAPDISGKVYTHTYAFKNSYTISLLINNGIDGKTALGCSLKNTFSATNVSLSSMTAEAADNSINWIAIGFGLLGVVALGQVALFAVMRRRN